MTLGADEPARDCPLCPRLVALRIATRAAQPAWHNAPVPSFGPVAARLAIVGLAPGLQGANRTGRPFTGDHAGELLYQTLIAWGFAQGRFEARPDDSLTLLDARITNAVRCVPPQNKPTGGEIAACRPFLAATLGAMPRVQAVVALGRVAHEQVLAVMGEKAARHPFAHGAVHALSRFRLFDSYHCSRYNTNTGRLTPAMFNAVFASVRAYLSETTPTPAAVSPH